MKSLKSWFVAVGLAAFVVWAWQFSQLKRVVVASRNIWPGEDLNDENTIIQWRRNVPPNVEQVVVEMQRGKSVDSKELVEKGAVFSPDNTRSGSRPVFPILFPVKSHEIVCIFVKIEPQDFNQFRELTDCEISLVGSINSEESVCLGPGQFFHLSVAGSSFEDGLKVFLQLPSEQAEELSSFLDRIDDCRKINWRFFRFNKYCDR